MHKSKNDRGALALWFGGLVMVLFAGLIITSILSAFHTEEMTCTVVDKDRTTNSSGSSDARLYTEDCGVLQVGDSLLSWTFSSSDTYASIEPGHRYDVTTRGFRIPFLSMFPNVVEAERVDQ